MNTISDVNCEVWVKGLFAKTKKKNSYVNILLHCPRDQTNQTVSAQTLCCFIGF